MLHVEPGEVVSGPACSCCARLGRSAFGFVHRGSDSIAFYYAWLDPHDDRRAVSLAISLGDWSHAGEAASRQAAAFWFESKNGEVEGAFIEPAESPFHHREVLGHLMPVGEVRQSSMVPRFLEVAEVIVLEDPDVNFHLMS